ncbi:MAG: isochorismatase family protein [Candidatus Woesearchaeota archaeon]
MDLLLIIDMQEGFRCKDTLKILPNIMRLKDSFKEMIVYTKYVNHNSSLFVSQLGWTQFVNEQDQMILNELRTPNNTEIVHDTYTVLNDELKMFIKNNSITRVYIAGIYTNVSIIKTAMDLFDNSIEAFIIVDACNSLHGQINHNAAIDSLRHILGKKNIVITQELL